MAIRKWLKKLIRKTTSNNKNYKLEKVATEKLRKNKLNAIREWRKSNFNINDSVELFMSAEFKVINEIMNEYDVSFNDAFKAYYCNSNSSIYELNIIKKYLNISKDKNGKVLITFPKNDKDSEEIIKFGFKLLLDYLSNELKIDLKDNTSCVLKIENIAAKIKLRILRVLITRAGIENINIDETILICGRIKAIDKKEIKTKEDIVETKDIYQSDGAFLGCWEAAKITDTTYCVVETYFHITSIHYMKHNYKVDITELIYKKSYIISENIEEKFYQVES